MVVDALQGGAEPFRLYNGRDGDAGEVDELGGETGEEVREGGHQADVLSPASLCCAWSDVA